VRRIDLRLLIAALSLLGLGSGPVAPVQGGYSTEPLSEPVFDPARVAVETTVFNNWLLSEYEGLGPESMKGPREHLYSLIDSWIPVIYERDGAVWPRETDIVLAILFSWSEKLGAYGGHLVHNALKPDTVEDLQPTMRVPDAFALSLEGDLLRVRSKAGGWSVAVPYYFMIWNMNAFDAVAGPRTELIAISTGAARHAGREGHSQATLMLMYGPGARIDEFAPYWSTKLGIEGSESAQVLPIRDLVSRKTLDTATGLRTELVVWQDTSGAFAIAYLGIDGTHQSNRPHFIDFLRAIRSDAERGHR